MIHVGDIELLSGVRFLSLDMTQPFVDILYTSEASLSPDLLTTIKDALRLEYAVFRPKRLRLYTVSPPPSSTGDKRLVAAPLRVVVDSPAASPRVALKQATSLAFYPEYAAIYAQLHAEHPDLIPVTRTESEDDLQGYLEGGYLFEIFVDDAWAGICAVFSDVDSGVRGFCFKEIVLASAFRGQGLGSAVQHRLAETLIALGEDPAVFLFGTIGAINYPALRAAARAGRLELGGHVWLEL